MEELNISVSGCGFKTTHSFLLCFSFKEALIKIQPEVVLTRDAQ